MIKTTEAIRLAEASDWKGLQRLIEKAPEYAQEMGDYGMLPIHWACTESHVPVSLLTRLLVAYPSGAKIKNHAELLPLHIAIRARVEPEWLEKLLAVYPSAVHVDAPDGVSVMELADQVGLHKDGIKILHVASERFLPHDHDDPYSHHGNDRPEADEDEDEDQEEDEDHDWEPLRRPSVLAKVTPMDSDLPPNFGRGSGNNNHGNNNGNNNNNTPVSPANSLLSASSHAHSHDDDDDDDTDEDRRNGDDEDEEALVLHPNHNHNHDHNHSYHSLSPPRGRLVSTFSNSDSDGSANTAPIPRTAPALHHLQQNLQGSFHRKHSLDYHAHAAAAAAAARQHQEMMLHRSNATSANANASHRTMSMVGGGRHQSLPVIPSFEHIKFNTNYPENALGGDHDHDVSSEDDDSLEGDNNFMYNRHSSRRGGGSDKIRSGLTGGASGLSFESPPEWKRDDECSICRASFGMFKHRHHCRNCGKSICGQHSADKKIMMESKGFTTPQRVCVTCYAMITHKQSREAAVSLASQQQQHQLDASLLQGAKITGPVAAFHQQMQQQQFHSVRSAGGTTGVSSPGSAGTNASVRSSISMAGPPLVAAGSSGASMANGASTGKDRTPDQNCWLLQAQLNEIRMVVGSQQKQIEQLTQNNMQMQQQILEQEELKAETMLLITQLMTRVSVLELDKNVNEQDDDDDDLLSDDNHE